MSMKLEWAITFTSTLTLNHKLHRGGCKKSKQLQQLQRSSIRSGFQIVYEFQIHTRGRLKARNGSSSLYSCGRGKLGIGGR